MTAGPGHVHMRGLLAAAVAVVMLSAGCKRFGDQAGATTKPGETGKPGEPDYNRDYVAALGIANEFCQAWLNRDYSPATKLLLSKRMFTAHTDDALAAAIMNPHHGGYEIFEGRRLADGRYAFRVHLFYSFSGQMGDRVEHVLKEIVIARDQAGRWKVDEFPVPGTGSP